MIAQGFRGFWLLGGHGPVPSAKLVERRYRVRDRLRAGVTDSRLGSGGHPEVKMLAAEADEKVCNIVRLIFNAKSYEGIAKEHEFSRRTMEEHWTAGYEDVVRALSHSEVMQCPDKLEGVRTFDWSHYRQE